MSLIGNLDIAMSCDASAFVADVKSASNALRETFDITPKLATAVSKLQIRLQKSAETFSMSANEAELYRLAQQGVPAGALATAKALSKQIEKLEDTKKAMDKAKVAQEALFAKGRATIESTRTPMEKYRNTVTDLKSQLKAGAIDQETFGRAMKAAKPDHAGFVRLKGALGIAKTALLGITAAAVGASIGLIALGKSTLQNLDDTGDMAARLGVSTEALTGLQYATELTGSHGEDLAGVLTKMNANLGDAATKGGPAKDAIQALGLDAAKLAAMNPDEAFLKIAGGFQNITNPAQRAALVLDLFGKSGANLINTISAGPEELARLTAEAKALGYSFDDLAAAKAGAANDALLRLKAVFQGAANTLAVEVSPWIVAIGQQLTGMAVEAEKSGGLLNVALSMIGLQGATTSEMLNSGFVQVQDSLSVVGVIVGAVTVAWSSFQTAVSGTVAVFLDLIAAAFRGAQAVSNFLKLTKGSSYAGENIQNLADSYTAHAEHHAKKVVGVFSPEQNKEGKSFASILDEVTEKQKAARAAIEASISPNKKAFDAQVTLAVEYGKLRDSLNEEIAAIGQDSDAKKINALRTAGATKAQIASLQTLQKLKLRMEAGDKAKEHGKELLKDLSGKDVAPLKKQLQDQMEKFKIELSFGIGDPKAMEEKLQAFGKSADFLKDIADSPGLSSLREKLLKLQQDFSGGLINKDQFEDKLKGLGKAKDILEANKTPLDDYKKKVADLKEQYGAGNIGRKDYVKGLAGAGKDLAGEKKLSGALEVGSSEARSALLSYNNGPEKGIQVVGKNTGQLVSLMGTLVQTVSARKGSNSEEVSL